MKRAKRGADPGRLSGVRLLSPASCGGWLSALSAGAAGGLAFEPFGLRALIPLAPLGLFLAMRAAPTPRSALLRALAGAYLFYGIAISWLMTLGYFNPFAYFGIPLLALYMALYPAAIAWLVRRWFAHLGAPSQFLLFAALWLFAEWFRTLGRLAMPFTQIGHAWAVWPGAIQSAEFLGELGVSLLVLATAGALLGVLMVILGRVDPESTTTAAAWRAVLIGGDGSRRKTGLAPEIGVAAAFVFVAVLLFAGSAWRLRQWDARLERTPDDARLRVGALQPNIPQDLKMAGYMHPDPQVRERLTEESTQLHELLVERRVPPDLDLLVMPESTFASIDFTFDEPLHRRIERMMRPTGADLLFGAVRVEENANGGEEIFNSAWFLPAGASMSEARVQDKMRLVPFGEYLPYFRHIPFLQYKIVQIDSFAEGREAKTFDADGARFGALICFESTFGAQANKMVRAGAEFLTVITNDGWYFDSAGPAQHRNLSLLRAVETRRPVVRAANTGISSIIDAAGRVQASLPLGERGVIAAEIAPQSITTFYTRWGNLWLIPALVGLIAFQAARGRRRK